MSETAVMTTAEVAEELDTEPKHLRKFFRSDACDISPVGQGKRYAITEDMIPSLKKAFDAWGKGPARKTTDDDEEDTEPKPDKAPKKAKKATKKKTKPEPVVLDDEDESLDSLDGPDDGDIEDLEMDLDDADLET